MNKSNGVPWMLFFAALIWALLLNSQVNNLKQKVQQLYDDNDTLTSVANDLNSEINNARQQAWTNYQNMGQTLEGLKNY